jgi:hypothetical protein
MLCSCDEDRFCKRCYSAAYYALNREKILAYQRARYRRVKRDKNGFRVIRKNVIISFS